MDCLTFRNAALADPKLLPPQLAEHAKECNGCARYLESLLSSDQQVNQLLAVEPPKGLSDRLKNAIEVTPEKDFQPNLETDDKTLVEGALKNPRRRMFTRYAIAASVLVGVTSVGFVQGNYYLDSKTSESFRKAASTYINSQPQLLEQTSIIKNDQLGRLITAFGGKLVENIDDVVFAEPCLLVPVSAAHLIIGTDNGPVTVMYAPEARVREKQYFEMNHFQVLHYPASRGSVAIFGENKQALDDTMSTLLTAVNW